MIMVNPRFDTEEKRGIFQRTGDFKYFIYISGKLNIKTEGNNSNSELYSSHCNKDISVRIYSKYNRFLNF